MTGSWLLDVLTIVLLGALALYGVLLWRIRRLLLVTYRRLQSMSRRVVELRRMTQDVPGMRDIVRQLQELAEGFRSLH